MLARLIVTVSKRLSPQVSHALFESGAGGIEELERPTRLVVYAGTREEVEQIARGARERLEKSGILPRVDLSVEVDETSRWASAWTEHLRPVALTPRLTIQPVWDKTPAPAGVERLFYDPKLAFGDGAHATTRLAALAVERACHARPGLALLDYGAGTGVLALVALRAGARVAVGVDIDPVAVSAARHNAELNGLSERARFELVGDGYGAQRFELCVANLELPTLLAVEAELVRAAAGAERLLLTGFLEEHAADVARRFEPHGLRLQLEERAEGWALLELASGN